MNLTNRVAVEQNVFWPSVYDMEGAQHAWRHTSKQTDTMKLNKTTLKTWKRIDGKYCVMDGIVESSWEAIRTT